MHANRERERKGRGSCYCRFFVAYHLSNMLVYLKYGSALAIVHTEIEVADQTFCFTQSQCTDIGQTSPSVDPTTPGTGVPMFKSLV